MMNGGANQENDEDEDVPPLVESGTFEAAAQKPAQHPVVIEGTAKKFDTAKHVQEAIGSSSLDLTRATSIKLSGNSYGFDACKWLSE